MTDLIKVKNSGIVTLPRIIDDRDGALCIMNSLQEIPFEIKRVYYINNLDPKSSLRGKHAHRKLRQVIFCINGCFTLTLDDGKTQQEVAGILGISQAQVSRLEKGAITTMRKQVSIS